VNQQTGTVTARAVFENPDRVLVPGQFVTLEIVEQDVPRQPVVPQTAVLRDREGVYVYVLGDNDTVAMRRIEIGTRVGNGWAVTKGLEGGEQVVVQGVQRLRDGAKVQPSTAQPTGDAP
jgi:membrane fusion protein (multidrug efflux system)